MINNNMRNRGITLFTICLALAVTSLVVIKIANTYRKNGPEVAQTTTLPHTTEPTSNTPHTQPKQESQIAPSGWTKYASKMGVNFYLPPKYEVATYPSNYSTEPTSLIFPGTIVVHRSTASNPLDDAETIVSRTHEDLNQIVTRIKGNAQFTITSMKDIVVGTNSGTQILVHEDGEVPGGLERSFYVFPPQHQYVNDVGEYTTIIFSAHGWTADDFDFDTWLKSIQI